MTGVTQRLGAFVASIGYRDIPEMCRTAARTGVVDCVGVMIAGSREEAPRIVSRLVPESASNAYAMEIPSGRRLSPADAALVNGVAAHALDYDDVALSAHPSAVLTPVILAVGQTIRADGTEAITAYVAGYEVWAQLQALEPGQLHDRGFHPTAVLGTIAAAAACARLRGFNADAAAAALGLAASLASGLVANFGTMTKPLHVGRAAQAGVLATELVASGFTASPDAIEHRAGFLVAHSPSGKPSLEADLDLGRVWRLAASGVNVKRYPTCYATHRAIDSMLGLALRHDFQPSDVAKVRVLTGGTQHRMLRNAAPQTALEAKFSMEFAMAAALIARRVTLAELSDAFVRRQDVRSAFDKVVVTTTEERMEGNETFAPFDQVEVVLRSGAVLSHPPVTHAKGSWEKPLSVDEHREKFIGCVTPTLGESRTHELWTALQALDQLPTLGGLPMAAQ
ncbi:MmgE/PrpD family protein [Mesorhizobium sp.]|uniref:MmgE/PrpD family protein n=1 Tax=Mesorhizobium sp. TaxID=1871066 RepID=UPI000FE30F70|nr:MmgE/PrpD family protein [Mesorhizobium sp.]RWH72920.1 MAG: MmgE/PrpD family protein [Mesorhizobium sp.]RWL34194.1 MAG: MmgE/PrpD family protein [Mesorhizobium sp.]RWL35610.1 MAG: MmgE/PrpD family protein [Mesorhizobium sp.]RWL41020.1 MAG: MmgE/PrpD family protein [Mesorhizobium sp.]RWL52214.1 MAG: MmgE/PrpD family protein [Mesorhizobium sp.]